jgi:hypothetical protein
VVTACDQNAFWQMQTHSERSDIAFLTTFTFAPGSYSGWKNAVNIVFWQGETTDNVLPATKPGSPEFGAVQDAIFSATTGDKSRRFLLRLQRRSGAVRNLSETTSR